jgi:AcrR family transcriptional regulator
VRTEDDAIDHRTADPRYERLLEATREAAKGGYDAVQMRELAAATRMSLTTVYQFCSSKDHLIAEAHADRMAQFRERLEKRPVGGAPASARVTEVFRKVTRSLDRDAELTRTIMRALYSQEPGVQRSRRHVSENYAAILERSARLLVPDR